MANSYYAVYEHIVFSTKERVNVLTQEIRPQLFGYFAGAIREQGCFPLIVGGMPNHVHLLLRKRSDLASSNLIRDIKRSSSKWLNTGRVIEGEFHWQDGYGAFSVSYWDLKKIEAYIRSQETHHRRMSWEVEFRKLSVKHGVEFDEKYYLD
ncbi:IS200/IS605 family transposase [Candidatus Sumerlaeota bacterium]|nr:IS200/IS605 family transposase [Candidatus Sumerlaeota bacterium]